MEEKQVTLGEESHPLPRPFLVLATQNPIEQEGTYNLPEAQRDRFLFQINVNYPKETEELDILNRSFESKKEKVPPVLTAEDVLEIRDKVEQIHIEDQIKKYIVDLVLATRNPKNYAPP